MADRLRAGVPGGSRQATDEELAAMALWAAPRVADHEESVADVERRWGTELRQVADRLLAEGAVGLQVGGADVDARIVRFWRGDALLEVRSRLSDGEGESRTRIPRRPQPDLLVDYLARAVAEG